MVNIYENNTNTLDYYLIYIFGLFLAYSGISMLTNLLKNRNEEQLNVTLDYYGKKTGKQMIHDVLTEEQRYLRLRYLLISTTLKAATYVKSPYLFALYNRVHGFETSEIGVLYAIDNLSSLVFGPIFGSLSDLYGRKKFCVLYSICIVSQMLLRITGSQALAYPAQIITGMGSALADTVFESWLNFETNLLFTDDAEGKQMKNSYLRELFGKQMTLDCFCSIVLTGVATVLYLNFGIFFPFYACIFFAVIAGILISLLFNENDISLLKRQPSSHIHPLKEDDPDQQGAGFLNKLNFSFKKLKNDPALFSIGIIESCFKICLELFLFIWTPFLEETVTGLIHPGAIFACFMLARLIGSELFESTKMLFRTNSYKLLIFLTLTSCLSFYFSYDVFDFKTRLFLFIYFDGVSGAFTPLMSSLKAQMIPERLRTTIMSFFRIPINFFSILSLMFSKFLTTGQICFICFIFMLIATIVNVYLFKIHSPPDTERKVEKTSKFLPALKVRP